MLKLSSRWVKRLSVFAAVLLVLQGCAATDSPTVRVSPLASPPAQPPLTPQIVLAKPVSPLLSPLPSRSPVPTRTVSSAPRAAPEFSLVRENGQIVRLADVRGRSSVVLVFYRGQT